MLIIIWRIIYRRQKEKAGDQLHVCCNTAIERDAESLDNGSDSDMETHQTDLRNVEF